MHTSLRSLSPEPLPETRTADVERLYRRFTVNIRTLCWEWQGYLTPNGYSQFSVDGTRRYGHRAAYEMFTGAIPDHLIIDHLCRVRHCVNPGHLEPVTHKVNTARGSGPAGEKSRQTECDKGHPFTPENTKVTATGRRRCRRCNLDWRRNRFGWQGHEGQGWEASKTHCPKGHPYSGDNLRIGRDGSRNCRACHRDIERRRWREAHWPALA